MTIHPTAIILPGTLLGAGVTVEAYAVVGRVPVRGLTARDPGPPEPTIIGAGTHIGVGAVVYAGARIGTYCLIGDGASVREGCVLGDRVRLFRQVTLNYEVTIGDDTSIADGAHITGGMVIGSRCFVGVGVVTANDKEPRWGYNPTRITPPTVGHGVLIGSGAMLCPGVHVGDGATVGMGALVARDVEPGATVAGVPGRTVQW